MSHDALDPGRLDVTLNAAGEFVVWFDGTPTLTTVWEEQVRRECARLFLSTVTRRSKSGKVLTPYRVRTAPGWLERRLTSALEAHLAELRAHAATRSDVERMVHQPSSLQRHWKVVG